MSKKQSNPLPKEIGAVKPPPPPSPPMRKYKDYLGVLVLQNEKEIEEYRNKT